MTSGASSVSNGQVEDEKRERPSRARGVAWPIIGRLGRLDPGSNPGAPTCLHRAIDGVRQHPGQRHEPKKTIGQWAEHSSKPGHPSAKVCDQGEHQRQATWAGNQ